MKRTRKISRARLEIYRLAVDGNCQASISGLTGKSKASVSEHIAGLLKIKALITISGKDKIKLYSKGPRANILDDTIVRSYQRENNGGSVPTPVITPNYPLTPNYDLSPSCQVHNHGVQARVDKLGDTHWLKECAPGMRGWKIQMKGSIKLEDGREFTARYQETGADSWLIVWVQTELTLDQMETEPEAALISYAQAAFNHISKRHGWQFGLMEAHKGSETHYVPASSTADMLAGLAPTGENIRVGEVWTDSSPPRPDGLKTIETASRETAIKLMRDAMDIPDKILSLEDAIFSLAHSQRLISLALGELARQPDIGPEVKAAGRSSKVLFSRGSGRRITRDIPQEIEVKA